MNTNVRESLLQGAVIPASPLALDSQRRWDERRQRALWRYYLAAGAGGIAVGVHTTQFAIRDPQFGLFEPLLQLARDEFDKADVGRHTPAIRVAGICGDTEQAVAEAALACDNGFHAGLLSLSAMRNADHAALLAHCRAVAAVIPVFGFYLQPAVGGVLLPYAFWRGFLDLENVVAIKVAPFNRYQTIDVMRAVAESRRQDVALYTGNDDNIVLDLVTPYRFTVDGAPVECRFVGGLLGHWACWTKKAVELLEACHACCKSGASLPRELVQRNLEVTDSNAVLFDAANAFAGCIPGVHEVLRRQGLLEGTWCLDPEETLSPGQSEEIDRIYRAYPHLTDDEFVMTRRDRWLTD
jgi:dihydrodipicolinate synthase/N-acetylneuraminate lyase